MAEIPHHDFGELWTVVAEFKVGTVLTNPGAVSATLRKPSGTLVSYAAGAAQIVATSTGVYTISDVGAEHGVHYLEVVGTSPAAGRERFSFYVDPRWPNDMLDAGALTSIESVELMLDKAGVQGTRGHEEIDKRWIATLINTFSKLIANFTEREFLPVTVDANPDVTRVYAYDGDGVLSLSPYEARSISAVSIYSDRPLADRLVLVAGYSLTDYSWYGDPLEQTAENTFLAISLPERRSWTQVSVTGKWGAGVVPTDVKHVCEGEVANAYWASRVRTPKNADEAGFMVSREIGFALDPRSERILEAYSNRSVI